MANNQDWNESLVSELHRLAEIAMARERKDHSLQPTAIVNEAYLVLRRQGNLAEASRPQFLAAAAKTIHRLLVDHARRRGAQKRGAAAVEPLPLQISVVDQAQEIEVLALHESLEALAKESDRAARVVELRFFGGMTGEEIADVLGISLRTVNNDWKFSKAWLYRRMAAD